MLGKYGKAATIGAVAFAALGAVSVKAAGDFQSSTQHLVTDAGEAQKNLGLVQKGILQIAVATGTTATDLSNAMYHIESSGYHGAAGLNILRVAAEGAKVGGADFDTVGKTLTGTMNSYGMAGDKAVEMMNQLIVTTGQGDMRMQDLASSLGNVAPLAAAAGVSFAQVGGAMATMTAQNMSAQQAAQDLANTIRALSNPNNVAIKEMQNLGLSSNDLSKNLGKRGLTGTLDILTQAVSAHTKGGQVLINTFNNSKQAAANADQMIQSMPADLQKLAKGYMDGSVSLGQWRKDLKSLPPIQASMMAQFATLANKTHSFNDLLKGGSPAAQTYNAAMAKLLGGATGLNTALMITGGRFEEFKRSTDKISEASEKGGKHVEDWDKIQGTFNQKLEELKASAGAAGIEIGTVLLPAAQAIVTAVVDVVGPMATWIGQHQTIVGLILAMAGGAAAAVLAIKAWAIAQGALNIMMAIFAGEMEISGIAPLIIGIAALVAGVIYAYKHFSGFRDVIDETFKVLKVATEVVVGAVVVAWKAMVTAVMAVWNALVTAAKATWGALSGAWNAVVGAARAVWRAITGAWNAIWSVTSTIFNAIVGFFKKWWPLLLVIFFPFIALLVAAWNHFHQQVFQFAESTWNAISSFFGMIWGGIKVAAGAVWSAIKLVIIQPIQATWQEIKAIWDAVKPYLQAIWSSIKGAASTAWGAIKGLASTIWNQIKSLIINPINSAYKTVSSVAKNIKNAISTQFNQAYKEAKKVADTFIQIGKAIVDGIVTGIKNGAGDIAKAAKGVASSALSKAKSFLGISSPSKVAQTEVGQQFSAGIALGIADRTTDAVKAVTNVTSAMVKTAKGSKAVASIAIGQSGSFSGASVGGFVSTSGTAQAGGNTTIFDLRGSQVMSDRDMDQLVNKIGNRLATRTLPAGGTHITLR
jgi:TP901 family phage tail tape measure protein